jgi:TIR domain
MSASTSNVLGRIFMSYRREETAYPAGWLFDRLASHFGRGQVFKDVDSIELGDDFVEVITTAVGSCDVLLALIGDRWLTITDQDGRRRLDNPDDFVRLEIEAALTRNVRVIPILVKGARMPRADELPASLAKLVRRQALELNPSRFDFDTRRLLKVLDRTITEAQEQARQEAEEAAAAHRRQIEQLQDQTRERAAAQDWAGAVAANDELAALDPAARLLADAERIARSITDKSSKASALSGIAAALAATDPDRAARLFTDAERIARSITDEPIKASALSGIAATLAATDPDRAERIANSIRDESSKASALRGVAEALAATSS